MLIYQKTHLAKFLMTKTVYFGKIIGLIVNFFPGKVRLRILYISSLIDLIDDLP